MSTEEDREALSKLIQDRSILWAPDVQALIADSIISALTRALEAAEKELAMRRSESADFERERDEADQRAQAAENAIADALAWMDAGDGRLHGHPLRRILSTYEQKGTDRD